MYNILKDFYQHMKDNGTSQNYRKANGINIVGRATGAGFMAASISGNIIGG